MQLFDHLVGAREQRRRDFETKRTGRRQVDDKLELGGLYDREVGWLGALEDTTDITADLTMHLGQTRSVGHQPPDVRAFAHAIDGRNCMARRLRRKLDTAAVEEWISADHQSVDSIARQGGESGL